MKIALLILGLVAGYLIAQLMMVWRTRNDVPPPPPGGWRKDADFDDGFDEPREPRALPKGDDQSAPPSRDSQSSRPRQ